MSTESTPTKTPHVGIRMPTVEKFMPYVLRNKYQEDFIEVETGQTIGHK